MRLSVLKSIKNAHDRPAWAATWIPSTETRPALLMTGSLDETVKFWKPDGLTLERTVSCRCLGVLSVAAHPLGAIAASASLDRSVRVFNVDSGSSIAELNADQEVWKMKFDPRGNILASVGVSCSSVRLWRTDSWEMYSLSLPVSERPMSVAWSHDGDRLAWGTVDGTISVFDITRKEHVLHLKGYSKSVRSLVYSTEKPGVLFSASDDNLVHMYDTKGNAKIGIFSGHAGPVLSVDASPDGAAIATSSRDRTIKLWDVMTRDAVQTIENQGQVSEVTFQPKDPRQTAGRLASVSDDKSISLHDYY